MMSIPLPAEDIPGETIMEEDIMKIMAIVCNIVFWVSFCVVMATDGLPQGADMLWSLVPFVAPILNLAVIRFLPSPGRVLKILALIINIIWLGIAGWLILTRYPSHPQEEGLIVYVALFALTPLLSAVVIYLGLRAPEAAIQKSQA